MTNFGVIFLGLVWGKKGKTDNTSYSKGLPDVDCDGTSDGKKGGHQEKQVYSGGYPNWGYANILPTQILARTELKILNNMLVIVLICVLAVSLVDLGFAIYKNIKIQGFLVEQNTYHSNLTNELNSTENKKGFNAVEYQRSLNGFINEYTAILNFPQTRDIVAQIKNINIKVEQSKQSPLLQSFFIEEGAFKSILKFFYKNDNDLNTITSLLENLKNSNYVVDMKNDTGTHIITITTTGWGIQENSNPN